MFFLGRFSSKFGKKIDSVRKETMDSLMEYSWPGNIRELQNLIERAVILSKGPDLYFEPDFFPRGPAADQVLETTRPLAESESRKNGNSLASNSSLFVGAPIATLEEVERKHVIAELSRCGGIIEGPKGAAKRLGLRPSTLRSRINKLGIDRKSWNSA
jgi:formate hydrogenlyase transcriptional activator